MKALLENIVARLTTQLPYLTWVGVLDDPLLPPEEPEPPFVGVKDHGMVSTALPGKKNDERLAVVVVAYQGLDLDHVGASIIGNTDQLGEEGKGLLDIADDVRAALTDVVFSEFLKAYRDRMEPTQAIGNGQRTLSMQKNFFTYWRIT